MKKKLLSLLVCICMVIGILPTTVMAAESTADKWDGTVDTSWFNDTDTIFVLTTAEQFAGLASLVNAGTSFFNKTISLEADIDLNGEHWTPIGYKGRPFMGEFDGNGHTISKLYYDGSNTNLKDKHVGLFGFIGLGGVSSARKGAYLHDFTIYNAVGVNLNATKEAGVVCGHIFHDCVLENIKVEKVNITGKKARGVIAAGGASSSQFKNIFVKDVVINAENGGEIGGLFSAVQGYQYPYVTGNFTKVGSFTAKNDPDPDKSVEHYVLPGTVIADGNDDPNNNPVVNCYFENIDAENITINVKNANSYVGGFVGYNLDYAGDSMFCIDCDIKGLEINILSGTGYVGGFVGFNPTVMNFEYESAAGETVKLKAYENCSVEGEINGLKGTYGGFVGESCYYHVYNKDRPSYNAASERVYYDVTSDVNITVSPGAIVGGFAGLVDTTTLANGNVTVPQGFANCASLGTVKIGDTAPVGSGMFGKTTTAGNAGVTLDNCVCSATDDLEARWEVAYAADSSLVKEAWVQKQIFGTTTGVGTLSVSNCTIAFNEIDGTPAVESAAVAFGGTVTPPTTPVREGYTFDGWYKGDTVFDFSKPVYGNVTLTARWIANEYPISYEGMDGTECDVNPTEYTVESADITLVNPTKTGYTFAGWTGTELTEPTMTVTIPKGSTGDREYTANWTPAQLTGTVTISGTVQVGETLTATVSDSNNTGTLSYQWYRHAEDSILMGESTDNVYVIPEDAVAQKIYCVVNSDAQTGTLESEKTGIVPNLTFPVGSISAEEYTGIYDGQSHSITVTAPDGTTVCYGIDGENYELNASPAYTDAGIYTIYYRVVKDNYDGVVGSAVVNIGKADPIVTVWPTVKGTVYVNDSAVELNDDGAVTGVDGASLDGSFAISSVDLTSAGEKIATITFTPADHTNYNTVDKADYQVTVNNRPVRKDPTYFVVIDDSANGTVELSRRYAEKGQNVIVTVVPDVGYELKTLTVTDRYDREIELAVKEDGKYSFKMPGGKVTVTATFVKDNAILNCFADVFASDYYYDAVLWAAENDITGGTTATTFSPAAACTRAQIVTFLWHAAGSPDPETVACPFDDIDPSNYYYKAVLWAAENGITGGTSATTFSPDATVTRAQTVTFLWRVAGSPAAKQTASFGDVVADAYYHDAVVWAADEAITSGTSATTFSPADSCLRGQIVTFLYRYYEN